MTQHLSDAEPAMPVRRRRRRRNVTLIIGVTLVAILLLTALLAPLLAPYQPNAQMMASRLMPPDATHWFGTDGFGRDLLSRVIYGTRPTLLLVSLTGQWCCRHRNLNDTRLRQLLRLRLL